MRTRRTASILAGAALALGLGVATGVPANAAGTLYTCNTYDGSQLSMPLGARVEACTVQTGVYFQTRVTVDPGSFAFFDLGYANLTWSGKKNGGSIAGATGTSSSQRGNSVLNGKWSGYVMFSKTYKGAVGDYVQFLNKVVIPVNPAGPTVMSDVVIYPVWSPTVRLTAT
ncbi:hypothetical protein GCM10027053_40070 [Intrasporangium mesophilum]